MRFAGEGVLALEGGVLYVVTRKVVDGRCVCGGSAYVSF